MARVYIKCDSYFCLADFIFSDNCISASESLVCNSVVGFFLDLCLRLCTLFSSCWISGVNHLGRVCR